MINHKIFSKLSINILIILSFLASISLSFNYLSKYDRLIKAENSEELIHPMLKSAVGNHWGEAAQILNDIKNKKNFFEYGKEYDEFLPQRVLALYYYIIDEPIYDENRNFEINNGKFLYLILKTLLFYLALTYFAHKIIKILPIKNCFFIVLFLGLEPTIFQFHSSFWNESLFFTFQLLLFSYLVSASPNLSSNFLMGIILGTMYMISQESFYLFIPIIFFQLLTFKRKSPKIIGSCLLGFAFILSTITFHNYKRTNNIFFMGDGVKSALYLYIAPKILSMSKKTSIVEAKSEMNLKKLNWIKKNNINASFEKKDFWDLGTVNNEDDRLKYYNYLQYSALNIIIKNPIETTKFIIKKNLHTLVLNPFFVKNYHKFDSVRGEKAYYKSETHTNEIPYRIVYTAILYIVILIGVFFSWKNLNKVLIFSIIMLALYPVFILGWMGANRYFVPSLIYLSFFFGNGVACILNKEILKK
ncbi:hypothetical protein [Candidatus Pelagibacter sp. Uisw_134_02]|jgi:hypothetical protein|uniref:hypothetical protein n=1 Tax=Candidatus Pelagibacter sp. Uisw_134_02 TaxID=3230990 RepID=UPI0039E86625